MVGRFLVGLGVGAFSFLRREVFDIVYLRDLSCL